MEKKKTQSQEQGMGDIYRNVGALIDVITRMEKDEEKCIDSRDLRTIGEALAGEVDVAVPELVPTVKRLLIRIEALEQGKPETPLDAIERVETERDLIVLIAKDQARAMAEAKASWEAKSVFFSTFEDTCRAFTKKAVAFKSMDAMVALVVYQREVVRCLVDA